VRESNEILQDCLTHATSLYGDLHPLTLGCLEQLGRCAFLSADFEVRAALSLVLRRLLTSRWRVPHPQTSERLFTQSLRDALSRGTPQGGAAHHRRLHNNLAMLAIARKSAAAVERKLQEEQYYYRRGITTGTQDSVPHGYTLSADIPATSPLDVASAALLRTV
jgi:hypothetical protein